MMALRIKEHPVLDPLSEATIPFSFNGQPLVAREGEVISSALYAAGISVFGHHHSDGGAQGIFCVNGQCSQCMVLVDGRPLKACMTRVRAGMAVKSAEGRPSLPDDDLVAVLARPGERHTQVLVLGGGPAGLSAAIELGKLGVDVLVVDDKPELGGKLTLQTHQFFGSVADCWAGSRGIEIGHTLADEVSALPNVEVWLDSSAVGIFLDKKVGVVHPDGYRLVTFDKVLVALGARERTLAFPGADLPGVYGAGAFQTLVNRDLVKASSRLFIVGGGNVGLIGAYHALQADIDVIGLVEAAPKVGGYKVHADKLRRLGVPIWTRHTVIRAEPGPDGERVGKVTVAQVDEKFQPIAGTERAYEVDTLLIAVGLSSCDELADKAKAVGVDAYTAGDAAEIAEASAAIFSGRITGREMARDIGIDVAIPEHWPGLAETLRSKPSGRVPFEPVALSQAVHPVIRCVEEIPCDPCRVACPDGLISMENSILGRPVFSGDCLGCARCVSACPGLAITLVYNDYGQSDSGGSGGDGKAAVMVPWEFGAARLPLGQEVTTVDIEGREVGKGIVKALRRRPEQKRRDLVILEVPDAEKLDVAGFQIREVEEAIAVSSPEGEARAAIVDEDDPIICRCERVRKSTIVREIRAGVRDINQLKALVRVSMGGCGGKTCTELVYRIFREEGVEVDEVTAGTSRPLVAEAPLGAFVAGPSVDDGGTTGDGAAVGRTMGDGVSHD
ncbi:MAG: FAD-dependent oxidoreductase [Deltaproteobacteria bacterium]|nr:FAD-dependent oxidoreductase [Deltaproteobacteria bacterium]